jgi:hypothetical protein
MSAGGLATAWPIPAVTIDLDITMAITAAQNIAVPANMRTERCPYTLKQRPDTFALTGKTSTLLYL